MEEILKLSNISYGYTKEKAAINHISLAIFEKEKIALVGSNGAGKSTLMLIMAGAIDNYQGDIFLKKQPITKSNIKFLRKAVGLVFQNADEQIIAPTVEKEIAFGPFNMGMKIEDVKIVVDNAAKQMNLQKLLKRSPHLLSGGEKKRVTIADIAAMESQIFVLDEPTASLDNANCQSFEQIISDLSNKAVVISTHDMDFVWKWASRVIVLNDAEIIADGTPIEIFSQAEVVEKANLRLPMLFEISRMLNLKYPVKNINEIKELL